MALTPEEKVRIRHHLGYMNVGTVYTFVLGSPAAVETDFMIEGAMLRVLPVAIPLVRELIIRLDATENQGFEDQDATIASSIGDITINPGEHKKLDARYRVWQGKLANLLGVTVNPYSKVPGDNGGGGLNSSVVG